jgi:hypothetical protein
MVKLPAGINAISKGSGSKKFFLPEIPVSSPLLEEPHPLNTTIIIRDERTTFFILL